METITTSTIICPQCGGENQIPTDEKFLECVFCGSAIYIDKRKVVNHYVVACNFTQEQATGNIRRWMAGNFHVKDLDKDAQIAAVNFYYFPLWYFKVKDSAGDKIYLQPAHSTPISEIKSIQIPAGNLKPYHKKDFKEEQFVQPDVLFESAKSWLKQTGVNLDNVVEANLVHIPFYQVYYNYKAKQYSALVEASSGKVYANIWPAKSETPFRALFALSVFAFFIMSIISYALAITLSDDIATGVVMGEGVKIGTYLFAAVPLMLIAYFIAKKV